jgi:hypothetical protein
MYRTDISGVITTLYPVSELTYGQPVQEMASLDKEITSQAFCPYYPHPKPLLLLLEHGLQTALWNRYRIKEEVMARRRVLLRS